MKRSGLALACALLVLGGSARADDGRDALAKTRFDEGRALIARGDYESACPKFAESHRIVPSGGAVMNLADCYEHVGKTASAWRSFGEASERAQRAGLPDVRAIADTRANALLPRLSRVKLVLDRPALVHDIRIDDEPIEHAHWSELLPIDPGRRRVVATSGVIQDQWVVVPEGPSTTEISIHAEPDGAPARTRATDSGQRTLAYVAFGVGAAGVIAGSITGVILLSDHDAIAHCADRNAPCSSADAAASSRAQSDAKPLLVWNGVAWGIGLAGIAAGAILFFTAPDGNAIATSPPAAVKFAFAPDPIARGGSLSLQGRF